ncbi:MAG: hypothetical protein RLZZ618_3600 [Pseudomonadota bacterium]|jgi:hypothetical protein
MLKPTRSRRRSKPVALLRPDRRYYRLLFKKAGDFRIDIAQREWLDLWHQHFDWKGFGDLGWRHRRRHVTALLRALTHACLERAESGRQYQIFALVHPSDSGSDAIYGHSENPNEGTVYPRQLIGQKTEWLPPMLAGRVDLDRYEVLVNRTEQGTTYVIQPLPERGVAR